MLSLCLWSAFAAFALRSERIAPIAAELRERERAGRLAAARPEIAASLVHMHANRLLR